MFVTIERPDARIYLLEVPEGHIVRPVASQDRLLLENFVKAHEPLAAINGGFFDPNNGKTVSWVKTTAQAPWLDPTRNERLTENQGLTPYLAQVFNRTEFRQYDCLKSKYYAITPHQAAPPQGCQLDFALGAGPRLLPEITAEEEAFVAYSDKKRIRDVIGLHRKYARSAVGIKKDGTLLLVMAAQIPGQKNTGLTLGELARVLAEHGAVEAMALDGGGSSGVYADGEFYYGEFDAEGQPEKRRLKSVLLVYPPEASGSESR